MLIANLVSSIAYYIFWISRTEIGLEVKAVSLDGKWHGFNETVYVHQFPSIESTIKDALIFEDVLLPVDKSLFKNVFQFRENLIFENHLLHFPMSTTDKICQNLPEFKKKSVLYESVKIIEFAGKSKNIPFYAFNIIRDDPKKLIQNIELAVHLTKADLNKHGKFMLAFLLMDGEAKW